MFLGHFALGFVAKKAVPSVSLGALILAAQWADLLWPILVLSGIEQVNVLAGATVVTPLDFVSYPYSHSLVALLGWGLLVGAGYAVSARSTFAAGLTLALLVVSHWVLDVVTHRPDMPLAPGVATRLGLGLWNSLPATLLVEALMFVVGVAIYARVTRPRDRAGAVAWWSLLGALLAIYAAALFGPVPPNATAVAGPGIAMWLLVLWAGWADRHRRARV